MGRINLTQFGKFIEIEALSPAFEPNWADKGDLEATINLFCSWLDNQQLSGMSYEVHAK